MTTFVNTFASTPLWERWNIRFISSHRLGSATSRCVAFAVGLSKFGITLAVDRPALVHLHVSHYGSFARKAVFQLMSRAFGVPVILHVHAGKFQVFYDEMPHPLRWAIRHTLSNSNVVVALGEGWAVRLRGIAANAHVVAIPNGVRVVGRSVEERHGPIQVIFLGKINEAKGVFVLLDVWARLVRDLGSEMSAHLTIAGSGESERANEIVDREAIGEFVTIRSWLSQPEVARLLARSDILVLPSRFEGQPMAVLEAMANGLVVVATDVGGIPEVVENGLSGLLVSPDDADALYCAVRRVLADSSERERLSGAGLERVRERYDVEQLWRRFDALYCEVLHVNGNDSRL